MLARRVSATAAWQEPRVVLERDGVEVDVNREKSLVVAIADTGPPSGEMKTWRRFG